jgi:hypothetical protein
MVGGGNSGSHQQGDKVLFHLGSYWKKLFRVNAVD